MKLRSVTHAGYNDTVTSESVRIPLPRWVVVVLGGVAVCDTRRALRLLETSHPPSWYLPVADWLPGALRPADGTSVCEWKGVASYLDVVGEPEFPPMISAVETKFSGVFKSSFGFALSQLSGRAYGGLLPCSCACWNAPPMFVSKGIDFPFS